MYKCSSDVLDIEIFHNSDIVLSTCSICFLPLCTLFEAMLGYNKNSAFLHLHVEMKSFHDALVALVQVLYSLLVALLVEQVAHQDLAVVALDLEKNRKN